MSTINKNAKYFETDEIHQDHRDNQKDITSYLNFVMTDEMKFLQSNLLCGTSQVRKAYM